MKLFFLLPIGGVCCCLVYLLFHYPPVCNDALQCRVRKGSQTQARSQTHWIEGLYILVGMVRHPCIMN